MKILIAEDNKELQGLVTMLMDNWDYDFDLASNGRKAVELAKANEGAYDLCLMDIDMPVMNGIEATKIIRREVTYFPIMAVTGNFGIKDNYLQVGIDDVLQKPYRPGELYAKISELTAKIIKFEFKGNKISIMKEMPMDQQHAQELKKLAKEGLCKMNIRGIGAHDVVVVTHKNIPYKISQDFIGNNEEVSIFLNRCEDKPAECHLYKSSCPMPTIYLMEEDYEEKKKKEDEILIHCTEMVTKKNNS